MMKPRKLTQVEFQEGVAVHHQELGGAFKKSLSELESPGGPERLRFSRVFNGGTQIAAIPELAFNLFREVAGAHDQMSYPLAHKLPDQQFEERAIADRRERFGRRRYHCTQASSQTAYKKNGLRVSVFHLIGVTSSPGSRCHEHAYVARSQYSNMAARVCASVFRGLQPVSLRNFLVLPKIIFSSKDRIKCLEGLILTVTPDKSIAACSNCPIS